MTNKEQLEQIEMCIRILSTDLKFSIGRIQQDRLTSCSYSAFQPLYEAAQFVMDTGTFNFLVKSKLEGMREELLKEEKENIQEHEIEELTELYKAFAATDLPLLLADTQKTALLYVLRDKIKQLKQLKEEEKQ